MKNRSAWMDRARSFAILCVILCHALNKVYSFTNETWNPEHMLGWTLQLALSTIGFLGVPLFLCLTGALMLGRDYSSDGAIGRFYKTKLTLLVACVTCWQVINALFLMWYNGLPMDWGRLIGAITMVSQLQLGHMWYTPMIIGVYLTLPFVALAVQAVRPHALIPVLVVSALCCIGLPSVNIVLETIGKAPRTSLLDLQFAGGVYGLYIVCGYLLVHHQVLQKIPAWVVAALAAFSFAATVGFQLWCFHRGNDYRVWYDFAGQLATGLFLFELFRRTGDRSWGLADCFCSYLSPRSFAVFFSHDLFMSAFDVWNWQTVVGTNPAFQALFLTFLSLLASLGVIALFSRIGWIRRVLFYMPVRK